MKTINKKKIIIAIASVALAVAVAIGACAIYVSDYYRADDQAIEAFSPGIEAEKTVISDKMIAYGRPSSSVGFIFYPGGKVEFTSYDPLMLKLASKGALCVLVEMPFNLAVLDMNAADGIRELYPDVERWYIGGHSLGGSMAASYLEKNVESFSGIVLLGSYSTADLSSSGIDALSIYGSEDGVMNREKYEECRVNLPENYAEYVIEGGCHAYFGMYGKQDGDGEPSITAEEQICLTADRIIEFFLCGGE